MNIQIASLLTVLGAGMLGMAIAVGVNAWLWPYTINTWLVYAGLPAKIVWWHGALIGLVPGLRVAVIPAAIITLILMATL